MTTPADKAREIARRVYLGNHSSFLSGLEPTKGETLEDCLADAIAQALTDAEARGRERGLEEAANLCEREAVYFRQQRSTTDAVVATMLEQRIRALKGKGAG